MTLINSGGLQASTSVIPLCSPGPDTEVSCLPFSPERDFIYHRPLLPGPCTSLLGEQHQEMGLQGIHIYFLISVTSVIPIFMAGLNNLRDLFLP